MGRRRTTLRRLGSEPTGSVRPVLHEHCVPLNSSSLADAVELLNQSCLELRNPPAACPDPAGATSQRQHSFAPPGAEQHAMAEQGRRLSAMAGLTNVNDAVAITKTARKVVQGEVARRRLPAIGKSCGNRDTSRQNTGRQKRKSLIRGIDPHGEATIAAADRPALSQPDNPSSTGETETSSRCIAAFTSRRWFLPQRETLTKSEEGPLYPPVPPPQISP
jgi:hypothetical protein